MNILILLIGANPLPNYIVGSYLLKEDREEKEVLEVPHKIIMVHSRDTKKFAERIRDQLSFEFEQSGVGFEYVNLRRDERNPEVIIKMTKEILDQLYENEDIKHIHLNHTGGTKPMSLYVHLAVHEWIEEKGKKNETRILVSDIDPDNHKIVLRNKPDYPLDGDLLKWIKPDIKTILDLHDMKIDSNGENVSLFSPEVTAEFAEYAIKKYDNGDKKILPDELMEKISRLNLRSRTDEQKEKRLSKQQEKLDVVFKETENYFSYLIENFEKAKDRVKYPNLSFIRFLKEGGWLEDFVFNTLIKINENIRIKFHEIRKNIRASHQNRPTELDIIALRGYKMFLVSCTTSSGIQMVKNKAFEAIYRAEQLGGEHAKAIIVSLMRNRPIRGMEDNNLELLKKDLTQFDAARNCRLIGIDELKGECENRGMLFKRLQNIVTGVN